MQHGRLKFKNAANIMQHERVYLPMSQMPCKMRGSISTMQVGVAECWKYNSTYRTNSVVCFSAFLALMVSPFFSSWLWKALRASWLHGFVCVHLFTATKATSVRKSQARPTPKQRPQHQQLLVFLQLHHPQQQPQQQQQQQKQQQQRQQLQLQLLKTTTCK